MKIKTNKSEHYFLNVLSILQMSILKIYQNSIYLCILFQTNQYEQ